MGSRGNGGDTIKADALWDVHASTDETEDIGDSDAGAFQFRDFRAKVATDTDESAGTRAAQALLGHTTEAMTADYIRHKVGRKVKPSR